MSGKILVSTDTDERVAPYLEALAAVGVPEEAIQVVGPDVDFPMYGLAGKALALVLCGGLDVHPERYGEAIRPDAEVELNVWGVCRGIQVLNVYLGGTLWQDLPTQAPSPIDHSQTEAPDLLAHPVEVIVPGAPIAERLTEGVPRVNSRHHQAIRRAADGFVPVALSPDGLVEAAVLDRDDWWVRGVQWHPENLVALPEQRSLWIDFIRAAGFEP